MGWTEVVEACSQRKRLAQTEPQWRRGINQETREILRHAPLVARGACPACGSAEKKSHTLCAPIYRFISCQTCAALYAESIPDDETLTSLYQSERQQAHWAAQARAPNVTRPGDVEVLDALEQGDGWLDGKSFLDVGCGTGHVMVLARERGARPSGVEINPTSVDICESLGFRVALDRIETYVSQSTPPLYDAIVLNQVLEHLAQPAEVIEHLAQHLRPGGRLAIGVPHARGVSMRLLRHNHVHVFSFVHLQLFTTESLHAIARRAGLRPVHVASNAHLDLTADDLLSVPWRGVHRASFVRGLSVPLEAARRVVLKSALRPEVIQRFGMGSYLIGVFAKD